MTTSFTRRSLLGAAAASATLAAMPMRALAEGKLRLRMSGVNSETDQRAIALMQKFGPEVSGFADFEPHWNGTLFQQGTELEAIASGDLEMSLTSAQELATFIPEFSIFSAGYVHQSAAHQVAVFNAPLMDDFKKKAEDTLKVKLLTVIYLGRRQINLRMTKAEREVKTPADMAGVKLRIPGSDAWQFLGRALGANPTPMAFTEVYTALQSGAIDGQDNPLPTVVDAKFYEVTKQIVLTSHLVDLNYLALSLDAWNKLTPDQQATLQKAADDTADFGRTNQLKKEEDLVAFLKDKGLEIYEPDVAAFRKHVQEAYLSSDMAKQWPAGLLDKINALGA
ncbi:C4-dicarboxylate ABC transporter [bacterium]|nr:C4-dicarboxylate ABC transporter [bacterium]